MKYTVPALYVSLAIVVSIFILKLGLTIAHDATTVDTTVNISQALPIIEYIEINHGNPINLTEGQTYQVLCNATIVNYNGLGDFSQVNATLYRTNGTGTQFGLFNVHDNNSWYNHSNCTYARTADSFVYEWNCTFNVTYHAYNGSWNCTVFANNTLNTPVNRSNASWVNAIYAMNVTDSIDYGDLAVWDTSTVRSVNVTNWGNMPINLTLYGYGGDDNATGFNKSFICPNGYGTNISIDQERWSLLGDVAFNTMVNLTSGPVAIENLTIHKQSTDTNVWNTTHWKLYLLPNPFGSCNGTVVYEATLGHN